jgi:hypothetical protein
MKRHYKKDFDIPRLKEQVKQSEYAGLVDESVPVKFDSSLGSNIKGICEAKIFENENGEKKIDTSTIQIAINPDNHEDAADAAGTLGHEFKHADQFRSKEFDDSKKQEYENEADKVGDGIRRSVRSRYYGRVREAA